VNAFLQRRVLERQGIEFRLSTKHTSQLHLRRICSRIENLSDLKGNNYREPHRAGDFSSSLTEKEYLRVHFLMEGLRGLLANAVMRARDRAKVGYYAVVPVVRTVFADS
jgi:hypothetical protein